MNSEHKSMFKTTEIWLSNPCDLYEYCSLSLRHLSLNSGSTFSWNDHKGSFNLLFSCLLYIWENCIWKRLTFTSKYCTKFLVFLYIIHLPISITGHLKWVFWTIKMLSHPGTLHTTMWAFYIMSIYMQYVCVCVLLKYHSKHLILIRLYANISQIYLSRRQCFQQIWRLRGLYCWKIYIFLWKMSYIILVKSIWKFFKNLLIHHTCKKDWYDLHGCLVWHW